MPTGPTVATSRIAALDLARFVALAGMFASHTWNRNEDQTQTLIGELVDGRAAALFAVLAGIGVVFVTRRALSSHRGGAAVRLLVARGLVILLIGLLLGEVAIGIYVVLAFYGLLFCVMAPLILLRTRWLVGLAVVLAVVGPLVNQTVRGHLQVDFEVGSPRLLDLADPITLVRALLITGIYPVITWLVYGLIGVIIGRLLIADPAATAAGAATATVAATATAAAAGAGAVAATATVAAARRRLGRRLLVVGAAAAAVGAAVSTLVLDVAGGRAELVRDWAGGTAQLVDIFLDRSGEGGPVPGDPLWLAAATPHSGTVPDLLITAGIAVAVIGLLLIALPDPGPRAQLMLLPLLGAGAAPLTVYSVHVVLTAAIPEAAQLVFGEATVPLAFFSSPGLWLVNLAVALLLGAALRLLGIRGPLEALVTAAGRRAAEPPHTRRSADSP